MRALITGGAGFIGSHLAELLIARGDDVAIIDDLSTGAMDNIAHLKGHPRFTYHIDSVCNRQLVAELVDQCEVVFHLAAAVGVQLIVENPVRTITTNVAGTEVVLQMAAKKHRKVLLTSTSEVYGKRTDVPFREDDDLLMGPPTKRRWSYACSKAIDEFLALAYWEEHKVPVIVARLFNTVGPRQTGRYGMVIPRFVEAAIAGRPIKVYGDGQQQRCFAYVEDVVRMLVGLAEHPDAVGQVINIGNDEETTIAALAHQVRAQARSSSDIVYVPYEVAYGLGFEDMQRRLPDLGKLDALLCDRPRTSLREILISVIDHMTRERLPRRIATRAALAAPPAAPAA
ncbi:MAG: GDP-mannose 4,6-dehydratase [Deltaproteobacteria bacterium]|nr:GDP-mannose 4,6-dehydratase [Deltaproteobacteria bacterium]